MRSATSPNWCGEFWMACSGWASIGTKGHFTNRRERSCYRAAAKKMFGQRGRFFCAIALRKKICRRRLRRNRRKTEEPKAGGPRARYALLLPRWPALNAGYEAGRPPSKFRLAEQQNSSTRVFGEREFSNEEIEDFVLLRSGKRRGRIRPVHVSAGRRRRRYRYAHQPRDSWRGSPFEHSETGAVVRRVGAREPPVFCACAADSRRGQIPPFENATGATDVNMYRTEGFFTGGIPQFSRLAGLVAGRRRRVSTDERLAGEIFARGREPHQRGVRPAENSSGSIRNICRSFRSTSCSPKFENRTEAQRPLETRVGRGEAAPRRGWQRPRVVLKDRRFAAAANPVVAGFFLRGRAHFSAMNSRATPRQIVKFCKRSESAGAPCEAR